jgi:hypothetical protein
MTMQQHSTVVGVFEKRTQAEGAIRDLQSAGFRDEQIGFIVRTNSADEGLPETIEHGTEAASGAAAGAVSGGILGGVIGAVASLLIPGLGPAIAGGILIATIGGVVIGAATGGIFGALIGLGVPEEEARYYEGEFQSGHTLVTVRADGRQQEASNILYLNGGYDVNTRVTQSTPVDASTVAPNFDGGVTVSPDTYNPAMRPDRMAESASMTNTAPGAYNPDVRSNAMSQTNANNPDRYNPNGQPDSTNSTNVNNPGASNPEMQTSQIGRDKDDINTGAYYPSVQSDQTPPQNVDVDKGGDNPPARSNSTPTNADINTGAANPNLQPYQTGQTGSDQPRQSTQPRIEQDVPTTSSRGYDPIKGPGPEEHAVPVNESGYGMQRDPAVETDATAKTYDTQQRPETTMQRESDDTFFGNPDEPGIVPGSYEDPNVHSPRVP